MKSAERLPTAVIAWALGLLAAFWGASPAVAVPMATSTTGYDAVAYTYDASANLSIAYATSDEARGSPAGRGAVSWGWSVAAGESVLAANSGARSSNVVDDVMAETLGARQRNITSSYGLTADEALTAGERWVGHGYAELGKPGSGVFRSVDGTRQFRMDANSLMGNHPPRVPHVHLEIYAPGARVPTVNNHIRLVD